MNAYWPQHAGSFRATFVILAANLILGHAIGRVRPIGLARVAAWTLGAISVGGIERLNAHEPAGFRMLAIIGALFYSMKAVVTVEVQMLGGTRLSWWRWLGFAVLWPGMRPGPFTRSRSESLMGAGDLVKTGLVRLAAGAALIGTARLTWLGSGSRLLATVWLLPGLSLVLHFGVFDLLAGAWRWAGVELPIPVPLAATVEEPDGVLGQSMESGFLGDDEPGLLSAACAFRRSPCGAGRRVRRIRAAS